MTSGFNNLRLYLSDLFAFELSGAKNVNLTTCVFGVTTKTHVRNLLLRGLPDYRQQCSPARSELSVPASYNTTTETETHKTNNTDVTLASHREAPSVIIKVLLYTYKSLHGLWPRSICDLAVSYRPNSSLQDNIKYTQNEEQWAEAAQSSAGHHQYCRKIDLSGITMDNKSVFIFKLKLKTYSWYLIIFSLVNFTILFRDVLIYQGASVI